MYVYVCVLCCVRKDLSCPCVFSAVVPRPMCPWPGGGGGGGGGMSSSSSSSLGGWGFTLTGSIDDQLSKDSHHKLCATIYNHFIDVFGLPLHPLGYLCKQFVEHVKLHHREKIAMIEKKQQQAAILKAARDALSSPDELAAEKAVAARRGGRGGGGEKENGREGGGGGDDDERGGGEKGDESEISVNSSSLLSYSSADGLCGGVGGEDSDLEEDLVNEDNTRAELKAIQAFIDCHFRFALAAYPDLVRTTTCKVVCECVCVCL